MKHFLKISLLTIMLVTTAKADASVGNDSWSGNDKKLHLIAGAVIGSVVTASTENSMYGTVAGCAVGLMKEVYDKSHGRVFSIKDATVSCAGAFIGSKITEGLYLTPNRIQYTIRF